MNNQCQLKKKTSFCSIHNCHNCRISIILPYGTVSSSKLEFVSIVFRLQSHFLQTLLIADTMLSTNLDSDGRDKFFSVNQNLITSIVSSSNLGLCLLNGYHSSVLLYLPFSGGLYWKLVVVWCSVVIEISLSPSCFQVCLNISLKTCCMVLSWCH